jgi:hypothetical protein
VERGTHLTVFVNAGQHPIANAHFVHTQYLSGVSAKQGVCSETPTAATGTIILCTE